MLLGLLKPLKLGRQAQCPQEESVAGAPGEVRPALLPSALWGKQFSADFLHCFLFIFKHTVIYSSRRRPCAVLEAEKGFLGHSAQMGSRCVQQMGKGASSSPVLGCVLSRGWNCLQKRLLA